MAQKVAEFVGIQKFSTDTPGLKGVIKQWASDFIVREIPPDGVPLVTTTNRNPEIPPRPRKVAYTYFQLVKFNKDTILAIREIAHALGRNPSDFSYAGIKDNRAISVQRVACRGDIAQALKSLQLKNIEINSIYFGGKPIQVGELWGNNFSIIIRGIEFYLDETRRVAEDTLKEVQERGFLNYYGMQRFGTHRPNSHEIGRLLLLGQSEEAVKHLLFDRFDTESRVARDFRERLEQTGDYEWARTHFPDSLAYEKIIINHLVDHPGDYDGAYNSLPPALQSLILSSFQSYIFNCHVNFRFDMAGRLNTLIEGDRVSILDDFYGLPTRTLHDCTGANIALLQKAVDLHHAAPVLPLIGFDSQLDLWPGKEQIEALLRSLGVSQEDFRLPHLPSLKNYRGSFRPLLMKPRDFELLDVQPDDRNPGAQCIEIQFSLPRGTYATCLLRELNKGPEEILTEEGTIAANE
ncbi:MAG TPA: tRNA pseudouridine(13) synthase TruD [Candidatus Lokiarchaeia archaeon]|nr:tRNA pseudouridine(13) synthase TruD [Candidatus Lokiarchaeia archaeon]